jgi:hypothetical protein
MNNEQERAPKGIPMIEIPMVHAWWLIAAFVWGMVAEAWWLAAAAAHVPV